jgi:hypothetical protein
MMREFVRFKKVVNYVRSVLFLTNSFLNNLSSDAESETTNFVNLQVTFTNISQPVPP